MDTMLIVIVVLLCLSLILAPFIYFKVSLKKKDELAKTISILGGFIAALSLFWAAYTYSDSVQRQRESAQANEKFQRELSASNLYREHMKISMDKPEFLPHSPIAQMTPPTKQSSDEERSKYEPYQWYVGHALLSFESILEALPNDSEWGNTFEGFIEGHKKYIGSDEFPCWRYTDSIQQMVKKKTGRTCIKPQ